MSFCTGIRPVGVLVLVLMLGCNGLAQEAPSTEFPAASDSREQLQEQVTASRQTAITRAVQKVSPAVVSVNVLGVRLRYETPYFLNDPFFQYFFGYRQPYVIQQQVQNVGSGFVISSDGYIVTNDHVVNVEGLVPETVRITVAFPDGRKMDARIVGTDPVTDIALLKVSPEKPLHYLKFGRSSEVIVGEWVIALGNPFGLFEAEEPSVTVGVISATGRDFRPQEGHVYRDMIQTDAAINQGNSGGPLVNTLGEVIGVNTFIISPTGQYAGLSFAVPSDRVQRIVKELREKGRVERSIYTGLIVRRMNERIAAALGLSEPRGVLVDSVEPGSPADRAGIRPYDVILAIDGDRISDPIDAYTKLLDYRPGDVVRFTIWRDGKQMDVRLRLEKAPE